MGERWLEVNYGEPVWWPVRRLEPSELVEEIIAMMVEVQKDTPNCTYRVIEELGHTALIFAVSTESG